MKIRTKILSGYLLVSLIFLALLVAGYMSTIRISDAFAGRVEKTLQAEEFLEDLRYGGLRVIASVSEYAWLHRQEAAEASKGEEIELIREGESVYLETIGRIDTITFADADRHHPIEIKAAGDRVVAVSRRFVTAVDRKETSAELVEFKEELEQVERDFLEVIGHALREERDLYTSQREGMERSITQAFVTLAFLSFFFIIAALASGLVVSSKIAAPLLRLREAAERLARGSQNVDVRRESADEVGDLAESFRAMSIARGKAEEKLARQALTLAEQNEDLKSFAYVASHDLREPLVTMRGFAGELKRTLHDVDQALAGVLPQVEDNKRLVVAEAFQYDVPEAFTFIESSISQMDSQIYAIQKLAQLGHLEIVHRPVDTADILASIAHEVRDTIVAGGGELRIGTLPMVHSDRGVLFQVFGHLVENAVKYRDPARPLLIEVSAEAAGSETVFHVRDNGRGIAAEDVGKIFEMFRSGMATEKSRGMGLTYVKALVRRMGGRIWCVSRVGEGTKFSFTVPTVEH